VALRDRNGKLSNFVPVERNRGKGDITDIDRMGKK
jgi:hypothetical protein